MKNKPKRHKESNTFKFQPFLERIANIDVDVIRKYESGCEESETYFHKELEKWSDLNLTQGFDAFKKEVPATHTLPQMIKQKDEIVTVLIKHIKLANSLSLQPLLELVIALARDLGKEFYPYYSEFMENLIELLKSKDSDQLEWTFKCLEYLFKFLWRYLVKDVGIVFTGLLPLLDDTKPEYINNFAAKSFAFVARKVKDKKSFLLLILKTLKEHAENIGACGRLLFEVICGVSGHFHSCADTMLPMLFEMLADNTVPQNLLFEVLSHMTSVMVKVIHPKNSTIFWSSIFEKIKSEIYSESKNDAPVHLMLKLVQQALNYQNASFVSDSVLVAKPIIDFLKQDELPEENLLLVAEIGAVLLMSPVTILPQEHERNIVLKVMALSNTRILFTFVKQMLNYPGFEIFILPQLLNHCQSLYLNEAPHGVADIDKVFLSLITAIVLHKAPPCRSGMELKQWHQYPINFSESQDASEPSIPSIPSQFLGKLRISNVDEILQKLEKLICVLICLPHIKPLDQDLALSHIENILNVICESLTQISKNEIVNENANSESSVNVRSNNIKEEEEGRTKILLFVMKTLVETLVHFSEGKKLSDVYNLDTVLKALLPYTDEPNYLNSLRALDLYLTAYNLKTEDDDDRRDMVKLLHSSMLNNFSSPFHEVRLLTSHIFSLFELKNSTGPEPVITIPIFSICLDAELAEPTVHTYRNKLKHLECLEFTAIQPCLVKHSEFNKVPLRFLLGNLYVNFQLLWEPTIKLIATHARGMLLSEFWEVFKEELCLVIHNIKSPVQGTNKSNFLQEDFLVDLYTTMNQLDDKPDYVNYRLQLWKAMIEFHNICESKNRDISPLFLSFIEEEYYNTNTEMGYSWNIKVRNNPVEEKDDDLEEMEIEISEDSQLSTVKKELSKSVRVSHPNAKALLQTLLAQMNVFSKMKDPKSMYREADLKKVYLDFLTHRNPDVQKMALHCLMAYKYNYLIPYRDHMYGLIDDKTFKNELTQFQIHKESETIQKDHREDLMPLIMRIVYSKMLMRGNLRSGISGQVRRSLVLRFLAGCHENEMLSFVEMAFKIYAKFIQDPSKMVDSINSTLDLEHIIPPRRLQSSLNLLSIILEKFGRLMGPKLLPYILRVLLCIASIVQGTLAQREFVHSGYHPILLKCRNCCQDLIARFFEHMETYPWNEDEIDTVFRVLVWPWLEKLPIEGIYSPTSLLKLFLVWSRNPRYFVLLAKHAEGNLALTPLPYIMNLLLRPQTHPSVTTCIMELVERLLTLQDYQKDSAEVAADIPANLTLSLDKDVITKLARCENLNYGSYLLFPHIPAILERLQRKLGSLKNRRLNPRDLVILSRATEMVWDSSTSDTLLHLILPVLGKKAGAGEDTVSYLITALDNLFRNVNEPEKHLRSLAPLFSSVNATGSRKLLIELLRTISIRSSNDKKAELKSSAELLRKLNAFDAKWVEQPDFNQRLDGFKQVQEMLEEKKIYLELGAIIIHNCYYIIRTEKDMSLRDSAGYCLRTVAPAVCLQYKNRTSELQYLISDTILFLIRSGIKDKYDAIQYESIKLLGEMARECGDLHPMLQDLSKLANKADPEVDFFENILHLQSHRKSRALLKFCQVAKEQTRAPNSKTLTHFILPLASVYICSDKFSNKHNIVDAAIEAIGTICRLVPWHPYETILRFYLAKLRHQVEHQKQLIRIIVIILDSFHFDLSRAGIPETKDETKKKEDIMEIDNCNTKEMMAEKPEYSDGIQTPLKNDGDGNHIEESVFENEDDTLKTMEDAGPDELLETFENILDSDNTVSKPEEQLKDSVVENAAVLTISIKAIEKQTVLTKSVAMHVIQVISTGLLPQIHRVMTQLTPSETSHKVNKKHTASEKEEEGVLKIPIALAAVKLLQRLPPYMLEQNLPGILMRLSTFLKSRLESIRRVTRETLQKIMFTLGPKYLSMLLQEMSVVLTRGYQVHVLIYTIHAVLVSLKDLFQPGDIDCSLQSILELCKKDLFGDTAAEKEVNQITGKLYEARSTKSYNTFNILAQYITEKCLVDLLLPIREVLTQTHSFKTLHKCSECLRHIVIGLADNSFVPVDSLLLFVCGIASQNIPDLVAEMKKEEITSTQKELLARQRPDTFIIPAAPRNRMGTTIAAKTSAKTNSHVLVEFGLQLFHIILKRGKLQTGDFRSYLDPMVTILCDCLKAQHVKLITIALKCMCWILKMDLPSLEKNIRDISLSVFKLLHKYASAGLSKGDNFTLVVAAFKAVTVIVRDVKYYTIDTVQMKALLSYAEQDMHDFNRQATAFSLLKAIISRKFVATEMHEVMDKVAELSITSEFPQVRLQARQVFHQFLMDYPLGKKFEKHMAFYIAQMEYKLQSGRESALEMIFSIIVSIPEKTLTEQSGPLFVALGLRLVNDDSPECRKMIAHCIKSMLERLSKSTRDQLFDITIEWFKEKKVELRRPSPQICGIFVTVEKSDFENRLPILFPIVLNQFSSGCSDDQPGKFVRAVPPSNTSNMEKNEQLKDHHLFQVLQLLLKLCTCCPGIFKELRWQEYMDTVTENCQVLLSHPHEWVRLGAAQFLGYIFSSLDVDKIAKLAVSANHKFSKVECGYFYSDVRFKLKSLILDLCAQLQPCEISVDLIEQVVKNLVFLGRVLRRIALTGKDIEIEEQKSSDDESDNHLKLSLLWMIQRMRKIANMEIIQTPKSIVMRMAVFKWIGAMVTDLGREGLPPVAYQLLAPVSRELISTSESGERKELFQLANQVSVLIKKKLGMEIYTSYLCRLQNNLAARRADRKKRKAVEVMTEPEKAAKRKIKKNLKKRETKKRKIEKVKGKKFKKKRVKEFQIEDV